jgi:hypothetical protein
LISQGLMLIPHPHGIQPLQKEVAMDHYPIMSDKFPADWDDPLDLFGGLTHDLISSGHDLDFERKIVKHLVDMHGAPWVWDNRTRLVSIVKSLKETAREVC